jgi:hypothetical protein
MRAEQAAMGNGTADLLTKKAAKRGWSDFRCAQWTLVSPFQKTAKACRNINWD